MDLINLFGNEFQIFLKAFNDVSTPHFHYYLISPFLGHRVKCRRLLKPRPFHLQKAKLTTQWHWLVISLLPAQMTANNGKSAKQFLLPTTATGIRITTTITKLVASNIKEKSKSLLTLHLHLRIQSK